MKKTRVYLDMDGTIADLYNQKNWLEDLIAENEVVAKTYQQLFK